MAFDRLIFSGLLYEGSDFALWRAKMGAVWLEKSDRILRTAERHQIQYQEGHAQLIQGFVSESLLDRVPPQDMLCGTRLLIALQGLAVPFRLLDLPDAVRQRIYRLALPPQILLGSRYLGHFTSDFPVLLLTSSQVRKETMPLFYSHTEFHIDCDVLVQHPAYLKMWVEKIGGDNVRHIQKVRIYGHKNDNEISFVCSATNGLSVDVDVDDPRHIVKHKIESSIESVEECREPLKLGGEAIFLALWRDPSLWQEWEDSNLFVESDEEISESE